VAERETPAEEQIRSAPASSQASTSRKLAAIAGSTKQLITEGKSLGAAGQGTAFTRALEAN
jgi:hypothetical protein